MAGNLTEELQAHLQATLNCLELCTALETQSSEPCVRQGLGSLVDDLQESVSVLAGQLRQRGVAPGKYELDRRSKARVHEMLMRRSPAEQLLAIRDSLASLAAGYVAYLPADEAGHVAPAWLASLSAQAQRMLEGWDEQRRAVKAAKF